MILGAVPYESLRGPPVCARGKVLRRLIYRGRQGENSHVNCRLAALGPSASVGRPVRETSGTDINRVASSVDELVEQLTQSQALGKCQQACGVLFMFRNAFAQGD